MRCTCSAWTVLFMTCYTYIYVMPKSQFVCANQPKLSISFGLATITFYFSKYLTNKLPICAVSPQTSFDWPSNSCEYQTHLCHMCVEEGAKKTKVWNCWWYFYILVFVLTIVAGVEPSGRARVILKTVLSSPWPMKWESIGHPSNLGISEFPIGLCPP